MCHNLIVAGAPWATRDVGEANCEKFCVRSCPHRRYMFDEALFLRLTFADGIEKEVTVHCMQAHGVRSAASDAHVALVHEELG